MKTTKQLLGSRIKELRKARKFSQEELAELIGVEPRHMSRIEVGQSYPSLDRLEKLANALSVELKDFFDFSHLKEKEERMADIAEMSKVLSAEHQKIVLRFLRILNEL